jgi:hypothetical protein
MLKTWTDEVWIMLSLFLASILIISLESIVIQMHNVSGFRSLPDFKLKSESRVNRNLLISALAVIFTVGVVVTPF